LKKRKGGEKIIYNYVLYNGVLNEVAGGATAAKVDSTYPAPSSSLTLVSESTA